MTYSFTYTVMTPDQLSEVEQLLCRKAAEATRGSYAPYSNYHVGAAVLLADGSIVAGANQENASYPCGTCAERTALHYAQSAHPTPTIEAIAIAAETEAEAQASDAAPALPYPCGMCRQTLVEAERHQGTPIKVIVTTQEQAHIFPSASCLLPFAFDA